MSWSCNCYLYFRYIDDELFWDFLDQFIHGCFASCTYLIICMIKHYWSSAPLIFLLIHRMSSLYHAKWCFSLYLSSPALEIEFTRSQIVAAIPGTFFCAWYASQKHWLANNILGLAFCIQVWHHSVSRFLIVANVSFWKNCLPILFF